MSEEQWVPKWGLRRMVRLIGWLLCIHWMLSSQHRPTWWVQPREWGPRKVLPLSWFMAAWDENFWFSSFLGLINDHAIYLTYHLCLCEGLEAWTFGLWCPVMSNSCTCGWMVVFTVAGIGLISSAVCRVSGIGRGRCCLITPPLHELIFVFATYLCNSTGLFCYSVFWAPCSMLQFSSVWQSTPPTTLSNPRQ